MFGLILSPLNFQSKLNKGEKKNKKCRVTERN